ncbi:MAG: 4Fe-4S dicluster domain-containing protein [Candidatus Promineifilaceae bacterium]
MAKPTFFTQPTFRIVKLAAIRLSHVSPVTTYTRYRWVGQFFFLLALILAPTLHILKLDLANDRYWLLGYEVSRRIALQVTVVVWLGTFFVNFLENYLIGRLLCGWVCSWGMFNRFGLILNDRLRRNRFRKQIVVGLNLFLSLGATIILLNFVVDLATLFQSSHPYFVHVWGAFGLLALIGFVILQKMGFKFCETLCPFGMYLSVVTQENSLRITFDSSRACVDCGWCNQYCPMDLSPREMDFKDPMNGGFGQCILCGDCIDVCKIRMDKEGLPHPLRWNTDHEIIPLMPVTHVNNKQ